MKTRTKQITLIYIESIRDITSAEAALLRKLSRKSFSNGMAVEVIANSARDIPLSTITDLIKTSFTVISMDETVYYPEGWHSNLINAFDSSVDLVSPVCQETFSVDYPYYTLSTFKVAAQRMADVHKCRLVRGVPEPFTCFMVKSGVLKTLSRETTLAQLPMRLRSSLVPSCLVHRFSDYFSFQRLDLLPYIPSHAKKILDVGCANGVLGENIRKRQPCKVYGIEIDKNAAEEARNRLDKVFMIDIEKEELPFDKELDLVIFADSLEHMYNPWLVVKKSKKWLSAKGTVVASIPNSSHYSLITELLCGKWDYLPAGLLCVSHFRFFTRQTIIDMFNEAGFHSVMITPQAIQPLSKEILSGDLMSLVPTDAVAEDILSPGYYVVAKQ